MTNESWESKMRQQMNKLEKQSAELERIERENRSVACTLSLKDLEEMSMMITRTKLIAMKLSIGHRDNSGTACDDKNYSIRMQRFAQHLQEIHDFYAKEH